jgi:uncharacterized protein (DUF433 family)
MDLAFAIETVRSPLDYHENSDFTSHLFDMATPTIDIGTLITNSLGIRGGRPHIAGTGLTVRRIVGWYKLGLTPEEILHRIGHPTLNLAQIYAALAYYHANREAIESDIAAEEADSKNFEQQHQSRQSL